VDRDVPIAILPENISHYLHYFHISRIAHRTQAASEAKKKNAAPRSGVSVKI
jgi:hypothetical protein